MINSLRLINWRSHADTTLEFKPGTNLLMGIMGSGKSSVLSAICFSLFGTFPELERRKLRLEDVMRLNENSAGTSIELAWNGDKYRIERRLVRDKKSMASDAIVYKNNHVMEKGAVAATRFVEMIMHVDYDLFTRAIYSEQNNIDYFLTVDPRKRREELDILLGLDRFETARANIVSTINRIKAERKMLEERFSRLDLENLRQRQGENNHKLAIIEELLKNDNEGYTAVKMTLDEKQKSYTVLDMKKQKFESLLKQKIGLESVIESLRKEVVVEVDEIKLNMLKAEKADLEAIKTRNGAEAGVLDAEIAKLSRELATIENKISNARRAAQELATAELEMKGIAAGRTVDEIKGAATVNESALMASSSERAAVENELKELAEANERTLAGRTCPLCGSEVNAEKISRMQEERMHRIEEKNKRLGELGCRIKEAQEAYVADAKRLKQLELTNERICLLKKNLDNVEMLEHGKKTGEEKLLEKQKNKEALRILDGEAARKLQNTVLEISRMEGILIKKKNLLSSEERLMGIAGEIDGLGFDEKNYNETRLILEEAKVKFQKISSEKSAREKERAIILSMKDVLAQEIEKFEKMEKDVYSLLAMEEELIIYKNALIETQTSLRLGFIEAINTAMNEIWHIFYPYRDFRAIRLNVSEKDYSFEIFDGEWKALESVASGGERACAALTLRVALAMVLTPNLSMLILDEPTHNLDKEAVELLSQTLQFKVPEVVEQTFVITHEEGLMGSEFASSYRLVRDKEAFGATKSEKI